MNDTYKSAVRDKIRHKPRLTPVFTSTHDIPEQVYAYRESFFICYNNVEDKFELHNLDQEASYCAALPYKRLDARTMRYIWQNDIRVHGKDLMRQLDKSEDDYKRSQERERKNWIESVAKETQSMFAKDAWA